MEQTGICQVAKPFAICLQALATAEGSASQDVDRDDRSTRVGRLTRQKVQTRVATPLVYRPLRLSCALRAPLLPVQVAGGGESPICVVAIEV